MSAPFLLCIWWKKLTSTGGYAGIAGGFTIFILLKYIYPEIPASFAGFWTSLVVAVIVSLFTQNSSPPRPLSNANGKPMDLNDRLGTLPLFKRMN
jgi:Na+/proline symporter